MSLGTAQQVTQAVAQAIRTRDGPRLAAALELDMGNTSLMTQLGGQSVQLEQLCGTALEEPYDEMLLEHFQFLRAVIRDDHVQAFAHQERTCTCFQSVFEKDSAWSLPVLHVLDLGLRRAAQRADAQLASRGEKRCKLEEAARTLQKSFQYTVTDRTELKESKKWGTLNVINNLFKIYFELNNLRLCQNLIRAVEGPGFPKALDGQTVEGRSFTVAQLVTYKYFVGRLSMLNSQFAKAEQELNYAFAYCPRNATKNKRLILRYLVPVRMVLGKFASAKLLLKYDLPYFVPLCRAVHRGDLRAFEAELAANQQLFIQHGSYLLIERAKIITHRSTPKVARCSAALAATHRPRSAPARSGRPERHALHAWMPTSGRGGASVPGRSCRFHCFGPSRYRNFFKAVIEMQTAPSSKIDLKTFLRCLAAIGMDMDNDEVECVLANLIYAGYIKGYISHQHGKLVVSKGNAFPDLSAVQGGK